MTTKHIAELPIDQQEQLRKTYQEYHVLADPITNERYIRFMGENVALASIRQHTLLNG